MWAWRLAVAALLAAMLVAAGYAELVLDVRAPHTVLYESAMITTEARLASGSGALDAAMKTKYGPDAVTYLQLKPASWVVKVGDKEVHREPAATRFSGAIGFFVFGSPGKLASLFPFRLELQDKQPSHRFSVTDLLHWFKGSYDESIIRYLDVNDAAEAEGPCTELGPSDFGLAGRLLNLRTGRFCLIDWTGRRRASALIGAVVADGDPWMRPFTGRICRSLTKLALRKITAVRPRLPDYAACIMVDRPTRQGTTQTLSMQDYGVGADGELALILLPNPIGSKADTLPPLQ